MLPLGRPSPSESPSELRRRAQPWASALVQVPMKADVLPAPIMIVDDDADDSDLLVQRLKTAGLRNPILQFKNGGDAFMFLKQFCPPEKARSRLPAVMFLDINMEGLSGFDVLVWARQQPALSHMKIFMLSGANEMWDAPIAAKLGADDFFEKFPDAEALRELLSPLCAGPAVVRRV
jgi:CheY-like chemotaxis protein